VVGDHGRTVGRNTRDRRVDQRHNDIDIVDHQIGDHIDIGCARNEGTDTGHLEETRVFDALGQGHYPTIETFEMPDLEHDAGLFGVLDQRQGLFVTRRERFFHEHMNAGIKKGSGHPQVQGGGHDDTDRINLADEVGRFGIGGATVRGGDLLGRGQVGINHADQLDVVHIRIDFRVDIAQVTDAHNADSDR